MERKPKIDSRANVIKISASFLLIMVMIFVLTRYLINDDFRKMVDTEILKKEIEEDSSNIIEFNSDGNPYIYAYHKYITILNKNVLSFYNQNASMVAQLDIDITSAYINSDEKYLAVGEKRWK